MAEVAITDGLVLNWEVDSYFSGLWKDEINKVELTTKYHKDNGDGTYKVMGYGGGSFYLYINAEPIEKPSTPAPTTPTKPVVKKTIKRFKIVRALPFRFPPSGM